MKMSQNITLNFLTQEVEPRVRVERGGGSERGTEQSERTRESEAGG